MIERTREYMRKFYEERTCICGALFYVPTKKRRGRGNTGVRQINSKACSKECQKEYKLRYIRDNNKKKKEIKE